MNLKRRKSKIKESIDRKWKENINNKLPEVAIEADGDGALWIILLLFGL